ncbi:hypothetical protein [Prochlorococcus sp. MIT 1300]|uniref:hypothetical protein n=1 Tax=Prochlorococcus sp. MIT 1300 TaxID=3096218 RepID=UPI002A755548|nr:hypothetical protein [Prochlorococcus sp. MIT 1300]
MMLPRWQGLKNPKRGVFWTRWDQTVAIVAATNLIWIIFDITYLPLRPFWLERNLYPMPSRRLAISMKWLPSPAIAYDQIKGIKPHGPTKEYIKNFKALDLALSDSVSSDAATNNILSKQILLSKELFKKEPFDSPERSATLRKLKRQMQVKSGRNSFLEASKYLLSEEYLSTSNWSEERLFWQRKILPLIQSNYKRNIDSNGKPINLAWRIDIFFQSLFLFDILLRTLRLKSRLPGITLRDALLKRWIDLPLFLPFLRVFRLFPITERLSSSGLIQIEPLRAAISQAVVALLSRELFEIIILRALDSAQNAFRSPQLPERIRNLRSDQKFNSKQPSELIELLRLWLPILLTQVGPSMRPQLINLFGHALQRTMENNRIPTPLNGLKVIEQAESKFSSQLAERMIDKIIEISQRTGNQIAQKDPLMEELSIKTLNQFWEELALAMEKDPVLETSQSLIWALIEDLKRSSIRKLKDQGAVDELITELDGLNFSSIEDSSTPPA